MIEATRTGASDRKTLSAALRQLCFDGLRGTLSIDPATNNIIQPIHVCETVAGTDGLTQKVLAQLPAVSDPVNGCEMAHLSN